jgi:hypothetical protein
MLLANATIADAAAIILPSFIFPLLFNFDFEQWSEETSFGPIVHCSVE